MKIIKSSGKNFSSSQYFFRFIFLSNGSSSNSTSSNSSRMSDDDDQFYDLVVCQEGDIQEGQMKEVALTPGEAGGPKCLLVKQNGSLTALSSKCTHFGAPLIKGSLGEGVVRCPWHGACFNVKTGDIEVRQQRSFCFLCQGNCGK